MVIRVYIRDRTLRVPDSLIFFYKQQTSLQKNYCFMNTKILMSVFYEMYSFCPCQIFPSGLYSLQLFLSRRSIYITTFTAKTKIHNTLWRALTLLSFLIIF